VSWTKLDDDRPLSYACTTQYIVYSKQLLPARTDVAWYHKYIWDKLKAAPYDDQDFQLYLFDMLFMASWQNYIAATSP
jgi:hypothetical protein